LKVPRRRQIEIVTLIRDRIAREEVAAVVSWEQSLNINIPFWTDVTLTPTIKAVFRCE
jgi:hypothetical protein